MPSAPDPMKFLYSASLRDRSFSPLPLSFCTCWFCCLGKSLLSPTPPPPIFLPRPLFSNPQSPSSDGSSFRKPVACLEPSLQVRTLMLHSSLLTSSHLTPVLLCGCVSFVLEWQPLLLMTDAEASVRYN